MEKDEILTEPAGRLLDCLIMEKIFGVDTTPVGDEDWYSGIPARPIPSFSTDISAAWEVVEKMRQGDNIFEFNLSLNDEGKYYAGFERKMKDYRPQWSGECDTAPLAICRAALLSKLKV